MQITPAALRARLRAISKYVALGAYGCLWIWCVVQYVVVGIPAGQISWVWPWCGVAATLLVFAAGGKRVLQPFLLLSIAGYAVELVGMHGKVFGDYSYTDALGYAAIGVPLTMGLAWALLLCYVAQMLSPLPLNRFSIAAIGAVWMTIIDLLVDPLAVGPLKLWVWENGGPYFGVPLSNFAGWLLFSFILLAALGKFDWTSRGIKLIGVSLIVSLALGAARHEAWVLVGIACILVAIHMAVEQWHPAPKRLIAATWTPGNEPAS